MNRIACFALTLLSLAALPATASAYWPYGGYGLWGGGYGFGHQYYSTTYNDIQPHFSVYPPVYYSPYISMRPYGASPYAWPPGVSPITTVSRGYSRPAAPEPLMIENPYVAGAADAADERPALERQGRATPRAIVNTHVVSVQR